MTETKPWWQSSAIWAGIVAALAPLIVQGSRRLGHPIEVDTEGMGDLIVSLVIPVAAGVAAVRGRVKATTAIAGTEAARKVGAE